MTDIAFVKASDAPLGLSNLSTALMWADGSGAGVVMDFLTKSILDGHGYQLRDGVLSTPVVADIEVTTLAAEMSANSIAGTVLIPIRYNFDFEALNGSTLPQVSVKMTATAATAGTAFTPLPLLVGGPAATLTTGMVNDAGGVTVVDDAATTTRLLYASHQAAVGNFDVDINLYGRGVVNGAGNVYVAIGSVTAGVQYFHALSYLEYTTGQLGM